MKHILCFVFICLPFDLFPRTSLLFWKIFRLWLTLLISSLFFILLWFFLRLRLLKVVFIQNRLFFLHENLIMIWSLHLLTIRTPHIIFRFLTRSIVSTLMNPTPSILNSLFIIQTIRIDSKWWSISKLLKLIRSWNNKYFIRLFLYT